MQTLLNLHSLGEYGVIKSPNWPYVRKGLKRNLTTVLRYYRRNPTAVKAHHFLVRLIGAITVPIGLPVDRYYSNVDSVALNTSMALKMTSSIYKGSVFDGVFYGPDSREILIATDESFNPFQANLDWQNLCPVKVLRHARSDLGLNIPDGNDTGTETGLTVITINIPMLMVQYRAFRLDQMRSAEMNGGLQQTVQHFLRMYVLPNMLFSHLDVALFNRINNVQHGLALGESTRKHPFMLPDLADKVDAVLVDTLESLKTKTQDFVGTLKTIQTVTKENLFDVLQLPDVAPTRQVMWGLVLAQLPVAGFLFETSGKFGRIKNRTVVNQMLRNIVAYRNDDLLRSSLPPDEYYPVIAEIDEMVASINQLAA